MKPIKTETVILLALVLFVIMLCVLMFVEPAEAENETCYVLCNPRSTVNIHDGPSKGYSVIACAECGDELLLDGKHKGEWVHIINGWANEDGWIHRGYVSDSPVQIETYQAYGYLKVRIRNRIGGALKGTLKKGEEVTVYASATGPDGWAYTNRGYIQAKYLDDGMGGI